MTTARDLIKSSLRKIAVLGTGSSLDSNEANDALLALNSMIASWSVEGNLVYTETIETFPLVSGDGEYTIGTGGDFNTTRPTKIVTAYTSSGSLDYSLSKYGQIQYSQIGLKTTQGIPEIYYYNAGYPLGTLRIFPLPTGVSTITIYSEKVLTEFTDLDTVFAMPPEYEDALVYNLATRIAPEYERQPMPNVTSTAVETKRVLESQNKRNDKVISGVDVPAQANRRANGNIFRGYE